MLMRHGGDDGYLPERPTPLSIMIAVARVSARSVSKMLAM
jgi:hypothetical protein